MSNDLNQCTMSGRSTRDGELRYLPDGTAVMAIDLATNREWKDASGDKKSKVVYTRWSLFGKRAEALAQYIKKGQPLILSGSLDPADAYTNNAGKAAATNRLKVETVLFNGKSPEAQTETGGGLEPAGPDVGDSEDAPF